MKIFISYKRKDKDKVFRIKDRIEKEVGEKCWIDLDGIESDAQFKNVIINAINNCEIVLFMYSKAHSQISDFENDWTVRELNFAASKHKRIVFVNIDGSPLTDTFAFDYGTKQQVDARSDENVSRLISDIKKWLNFSSGTSENGHNAIQKPEKASNFLVDGISKTFPNHGDFIIANVIAWSIVFAIYVLIAGSKAFNGTFELALVLSILLVVVMIVGLSNPSLLLLEKRKDVAWYFISLLIMCIPLGKSIKNSVVSEVDNVKAAPIFEIQQDTLVDLGLSVLWASQNIGAENPTGKGYYYGWGSTNHLVTDKEFRHYPSSNPPNSISGIRDFDISMSKIIGNKTLRLPTKMEAKELVDSCIWIDTEINGQRGCKVTGPNGNSIFLPASGWSENGKYHEFDASAHPVTLNYWTGTLFGRHDSIYRACSFHYNHDRKQHNGNGLRYYGFTIRPVADKL